MISFDDLRDRAAARGDDAPTLDDAYARAALAQLTEELDPVAYAAEEPVIEAEPAERPLGRYLAFQAKDWLLQRGSVLAVLGAFALWIFWRNYDPAVIAERVREQMAAMAKVPGWNGRITPEPERFANVFLGLSMAGAFLGAMIGLHGVVSQERERGLQRFLFAKPVSLLRYYAQKVGVSVAGIGAVLALFALAVSVTFGRGLPVGTAALVASAIVTLVGGVTFLLSTLVRGDGLIAAALALASLPVAAAAREQQWLWARLLEPVLPPLHAVLGLLGQGRGPWAMDPLLAGVWIFGYGIACFVGGFWILRRRSILT